MAKLAIRLRKLHFRGFRIRDRQRSVGISAMQIDRATDLGEPFFGVALGVQQSSQGHSADHGPRRGFDADAKHPYSCLAVGMLQPQSIKRSSFHSWVI